MKTYIIPSLLKIKCKKGNIWNEIPTFRRKNHVKYECIDRLVMLGVFMVYSDSDSEQQKNFLPVDTCQPSISLDQSNRILQEKRYFSS